MASYEVEAYSLLKLTELFDKYSHKSEGNSKAKRHLSFFDEYLKVLSAKTIVIETSYTDRDYLEDYAAYYARCHDDYKKRCARLHFFDQKFDPRIIEKILEDDRDEIEKFQSSYLGFVVLKPLPSTVIGRSCLVPYNDQTEPRSFPAIREYQVHILGIELGVISLAFQEQDRDVAACATSSLWSMFHATGLLFQHHIPTPAEITKAATVSRRPLTRALPASEGLSAPQIADAIRSVGLEPLQIGTKNLNILRIVAAAYLRARIPCILLGQVVNRSTAPEKLVGYHAITLNGYSNPDGKPQPTGVTDALFTSTAIESFFAHDDQVGPFARLGFDKSTADAMQTSWHNDVGTIGDIFFKPEILVVPLYHKVRVPITSILSTLVALDEFIEAGRTNGILPLVRRIEWDVFLIENAALKAEVRLDSKIGSAFRQPTLTEDMPRYIWRASAVCDGSKLFDFMFDATDLLQGGHLLGGLPYASNECKTIAAFLGHPSLASSIQATKNRGFERTVNWFADNSSKF